MHSEDERRFSFVDQYDSVKTSGGFIEQAPPGADNSVSRIKMNNEDTLR